MTDEQHAYTAKALADQGQRWAALRTSANIANTQLRQETNWYILSVTFGQPAERKPREQEDWL